MELLFRPIVTAILSDLAVWGAQWHYDCGSECWETFERAPTEDSFAGRIVGEGSKWDLKIWHKEECIWHQSVECRTASDIVLLVPALQEIAERLNSPDKLCDDPFAELLS